MTCCFSRGVDFTILILLFVVNFLLNILKSVNYTLTFVFGLLLNCILDMKMTETSKKRKRNSVVNSNQTIMNRGIISGNWQQFLQSNMISDQKTKKPSQENNKEHYTGAFRRSRKKKLTEGEPSNSVQNNLKSLNIHKENNNIVNDNQNLDENLLQNNEKMNRNQKNNLTKFIAMDCEMVGIGYDGSEHMLARVSLVNKFGDCIYDKFVKAREEVTDYRTKVSGVRKEDLMNGEEFSTVQKEVAEILKGRVLVGHSLKNDLSVLFLSHPKRNIRDTSKYKPFKKITKGNTPSLKRLAKEVLNIDIQHGEHSSIEDAKATMQLYRTVAKDWERTVSQKRGYRTYNED